MLSWDGNIDRVVLRHVRRHKASPSPNSLHLCLAVRRRKASLSPSSLHLCLAAKQTAPVSRFARIGAVSGECDRLRFLDRTHHLGHEGLRDGGQPPLHPRIPSRIALTMLDVRVSIKRVRIEPRKSGHLDVRTVKKQLRKARLKSAQTSHSPSLVGHLASC